MLAVLLIVAALVIEFFIFPNINQYKDTIAEQASIIAKQKVSIGQIQAGWRGLNPNITMENIVLFDAENRPALALNEVDAALSWLSVAMLEPHFAAIDIKAPSLSIRRTVNNEIFVAGVSLSGPSKPELSNWLLRQNAIHITNANIVWLDELRNAPPLSLNQLNLSLITPAWKKLLKNHQLTISAIPSVGTQHPITLHADLYGNDISQMQAWHGTVEIQQNALEIAAFKAWIDYPVDVVSGNMSAKTKIQFAQGSLRSIQTEAQLTQLVMPLKANAAPASFNSVAANIFWENLNTKKSATFALNLNSPSFKVNATHVFITANQTELVRDLSVNYTQIGIAKPSATATASVQSQAASIAFDYANIGAISPYLLQLPLPEPVMQTLESANAEGKLKEFSAAWEGTGEANNQKTTHYKIATDFEGLGISASGINVSGISTSGLAAGAQSNTGSPIGFSGLSGSVNADQDGGKLTLNTKQAALDFKGILRYPILNNQLDGSVKWRIETLIEASNAPQLHISTSDFKIKNAHLSGKVSADYEIHPLKSHSIDLTATFDKGDAKYAPFYYPTSLNAETLHWLDTSIKAGELSNIKLVLKGNLKDFPFVNAAHVADSKLGIFRVTANMQKGLLEYGKDWPHIEDLSTSLLFEGTRMELNATGGHILGNQIIKSKTTIAQLDADEPILNIVSEAQGLVVEGIKFVNSSPVATITQGFTNNLKTSGNGHLDLSLRIPLQNIEQANYKGAYRINNGSMQSPSVPLLTNINGTLNFNETSLSANNVKAQFYGTPLAFNIITDKDKTIRVAAKGRLNNEAISQLIGKANQYIAGSAAWVANIAIQNKLVNVVIRSDLLGLASALPEPFNKQAGERASLRIQQKQLADTDVTQIFYNNLLSATVGRKLVNDGFQLQFANIAVGSTAQNATETAANNTGLTLTGALNSLDIDDWLNTANNLVSNTNTPNIVGALAIKKIDLQIADLTVFNRHIHQLIIKNVSTPANSSNASGLQANVDSQEIKGDVQWLAKSGIQNTSQANGKLIARLTQLNIPADKTVAPTTQNTNALKDFKQLKQDYPALDITADDVAFDNKKIGALALLAYPKNDNWVIQKLKVTNPDSVLSVDGEWNNWVRSPNTRLNIDLAINDLGKTMNRFGHPDTIKDGEGHLSGQLNWAGSPHEFNTRGLNGNLSFDIRKGQILKVQPGVGRLFGLVSLQSLPRRLTLDFRDLFSSGFAFDSIKADVKVSQGLISSENFAMAGPAADVQIKGEANMINETQNMHVKVNPRISDSVSLAALAGGPLVGAIAFLAQKILKDPLNKIASTEYVIGGTWDNPVELKTSDLQNTEKP